MRLDSINNYKVLFIGDGIIDEYRYVEPIGKSVKDNILSTKYDGKFETFYGGAWAAAAHLREFCKQVDVWTGPDVMRNLRYVEPVYNRKLITVHHLHPVDDISVCGAFPIGAYDVVVVTDFGHGAMTKELRERV